MIEFLNEWIEQIIIAVIIASIFEMILPNGKTRKYIKMILGVFIIFNMISPFVNGSDLYNFNVTDIVGDYMDDTTVNDAKSKNNMDDKVEKLYIQELEKDIAKTIEEQGYTVKKCEIDAVIYSDKNETGINSINIIIIDKTDLSSQDLNQSKIDEINEVKIEVNVKSDEEKNKSNITGEDIKELKKHLSRYYEINEDIININ